MLKAQILVHKASSVPVVSLMAAVIDVDAVSDEAAAMRHLEASNPAILAVIGGEMRTPRTFATYKVNKVQGFSSGQRRTFVKSKLLVVF